MPVTTTISEAGELVGIHLPATPPRIIAQGDIDAFAALTGDDQWIHTDVERAAQFGGTIVHGLLLTGLIGGAWGHWLDVVDADDALNYGLDRIRFLAPVPVGSAVVLDAEVVEAVHRLDGVRLALDIDVRIDGREEPVLIARSLVLFRH